MFDHDLLLNNVGFAWQIVRSPKAQWQILQHRLPRLDVAACAGWEGVTACACVTISGTGRDRQPAQPKKLGAPKKRPDGFKILQPHMESSIINQSSHMESQQWESSPWGCNEET